MSPLSDTRFPELLLVIEASTARGSVALVRDGICVVEHSVTMGPAREDALMPAIVATLDQARSTMREVRGIACGSGPGSFTSLRIAAALAKGFAQSGNIPLFAIPSMLLAALELRTFPGQYLLHGDALRGERFVQQFDTGVYETVTTVGDMQRLSLADTEQLATSKTLQLVTIGSVTVSALDERAAVPRAANASALFHTLHAFGPVDIAAWEPNYGRLAEAQVKWEETHQRALPTS
ncbi:MAG: tRNA (adenosine(37)-N6)-threonylcarbamoyltransferase complex dimerization subunit type 1 TsaB [Phycisphaerae bacterium]|nr:tRNA (adenosine(37)-N6)-threonylcarbamoyltransferase complex dimerization subunit type 1 TsaB [Gemmatimonadaceae bacterium]